VWKVAMKKHGNNITNFWQRKNYDADAICEMQNHVKVRRAFVDIATLPLGLKENLHENLNVGIRD
jgi:hypothetical protein